MASSRKTDNIKLNQFDSADKPTWLGDYNEDMKRIDNAFYDIQRESKTSSQNAAAASSEVALLRADIAELKTRLSKLENK